MHTSQYLTVKKSNRHVFRRNHEYIVLCDRFFEISSRGIKNRCTHTNIDTTRLQPEINTCF